MRYQVFSMLTIEKFYLNITHKTQNREKKAIENAKNFLFTNNKKNEFLKLIDNMSDKTIVNFVTAIGDYKLPNNIDIKDTEIYYYHVTKINEMLSKKQPSI